jgi:cysteine desulfuration protein SufE
MTIDLERNIFLRRLKESKSNEELYIKIIEMGKAAPLISAKDLPGCDLIEGCQSTMYLKTTFNKEGALYFAVHSEALISKGLAALLISVYNGQTPLDILRTPPLFLQEYRILEALSPNRANGVHALWLRIKADALKYLTAK